MDDTYNGGSLYTLERFQEFLRKGYVNPEAGEGFWHDGFGESSKPVMFEDGQVVVEKGWSHVAWYPKKEVE